MALLALLAGADASPALLGSGLLTLRDARTAAPGRPSFALGLDNRDRDPLGLDLLDAALGFTLGLTPRLEAHGQLVLSRVVALPEAPVLPPPPLDLVIAPGATLPPRPHYALHAQAPYVDKRGSARLDAWVPGDALLGLKLRLRDPARDRTTLALAARVRWPRTRDPQHLRSGSGTGGTDLTLEAIGERRFSRGDLVVSLAWTRTGAPRAGDRLLAVEGAGVRETEAPLELPDRLEPGLGFRRRVGARLEAIAEAFASLPVGARTPLLDQRAPLDLLAGVKWSAGGARLLAGLRYHGHALPSGQERAAPLAGLIDLTDVAAEPLTRYLEQAGAGPAAGRLRASAQRVLVPGPGAPPPPPGARVIPRTYTTRSEHQVGFVLQLGWAF